VEENHSAAAEQGAGRRVDDGAAAEREHTGVVDESSPDRVALKGSKCRLAALDEDLADRLADVLLDVIIRIPEPDTEPVSHPPPHRGLAAATRPAQYHGRAARAHRDGLVHARLHYRMFKLSR